MDAIYDYFWDFVQDNLPYSVYDALYTFSGHLHTAFAGINTAFTWAYKSASGTQEVERLSVSEQIIPPLLSIIAIYFGLISIYRTTASFVRTTLSIVKWVIIISLLAMGAGFFAARGPVDTGMLLRIASMLANGAGERRAPQGEFGDRRNTRAERAERQQDPRRQRPGIFDTFLAHDEWRNGQAQVEDTQAYVKRVVDSAQKVFKDGSGFVDLLFKKGAEGSRDEYDGDEDDEGTAGRRRTRAQTRRRRENRA